MTFHPIGKHLTSQVTQTRGSAITYSGISAELYDPTLSHSARLDILYREAGRLGQDACVEMHHNRQANTWTYKLGLECDGRKTPLFKSREMQDCALNPYAAFCAEHAARKQARRIQTCPEDFTLEKMTSACISTMAEPNDRPALLAALDDPRYCSENFVDLYELMWPDSRFVARFKSSPERSEPDLQLCFSSRMATHGEFGDMALKQALKDGKYSSLRDMIAAKHGTAADPVLMSLADCMRSDFEKSCQERALTDSEVQDVLQVLDSYPMGKTTAGEIWYPSAQFPRLHQRPDEPAPVPKAEAARRPGKRARLKKAVMGLRPHCPALPDFRRLNPFKTFR